MKRYHIAAAALLSLLLVPILAQAQNDGETFEQYRERMRKEYAGYKKQAQDDFAAYRKKVNEEYAEFLKNRWREMDMLKGKTPPEDTVPPAPPVVCPEEDRNKERKNTPQPIEEVVKPEPPKPQPQPVTPVEEPKPAPRMDTIRFQYWNTPMECVVEKRPTFTLYGLDGESIAKAWSTLSDGRCEQLLAQCLKLRQRYNLSDWAYLQVCDNLAHAVIGKTNNEYTLLYSWLYCQSGYKMRLATKDGSLYMFFGCSDAVYHRPYLISCDGVYFGYKIGCMSGVKFCEAVFPKEQDMSIYITQQPLLNSRNSDTRTLQSKRYPEMRITSNVNRNLIDFYNQYPTGSRLKDPYTKWAIYANIPISSAVRQTLYPQLRQKLQGKNKVQAVEELLNWVQTSLVYEYDSVVWGGDRAFFPEESLYYPYADCEDRAILFTRLVRDILGLRCVLVFYPGHLGAAVRFEGEKPQGDMLHLDDGDYFIADPTYIGAPIGMTMPRYKNTEVKVVRINNP